MFQNWRLTLEKCPLFLGIPFDELGGMLRCLAVKPKQFHQNQFVTQTGDPFCGIGILLSGTVAVTRENTAGNRVIMIGLEAGQIFGEIIAYAGDGRWLATMVAQSDSMILFLPPEKITNNCKRQCSSHHLLLFNMLTIISSRALFLSKKIDYLTKKSLRGKIAAYLLAEYQKTGQNTFNLPFSRNELADFLNVTRPGLSREMGRMRSAGTIDFHKESIVLKDIDALQKEAF